MVAVLRKTARCMSCFKLLDYQFHCERKMDLASEKSRNNKTRMREIDVAQSIASWCSASQEVIDLRPTLILTQ